jgi:PAS domain S-box-containing protein
MIYVDLLGRIVFTNRVLSELERDKVIGSSWLGYSPPEIQPAMIAALNAVVATGKPQEWETTGPGPNGTATYANRLAPVTRDGRLDGVLLVARDVTEKKQAEAQLIVSDRLASVGTLAAGVAHEINNPLTFVTANIVLATQEIQSMAAGSPALRTALEALRDASDGAERVRGIVQDLKLFSRTNEDVRTSVDVEQVLEATLRLAASELKPRARITRKYGNIPQVHASEARLGQVFLNLVINAAHAIPEGDSDRNEICVETLLDPNGRVAIRITDTGCGIPADVQKTLFTPFLSTKPVGGGAGLGLSICHRLITALGGEITFSSEVGKGSAFRVSLPIGDVVQADVSPKPVAAPTERRGRVLAIDDEPYITRLLVRALGDRHDVTCANAGAEAMARLESGERFDVVLCDLMMPQMTGMDLHAAITQLDPLQAQRTIFLTGGAFTPKGREFLDAVANRHVDKPFDVQALRGIVSAMVAAPRLDA